jgi:hypothetical protein
MTTITPVNVADITDAVEQLLRNWQPLMSAGVDNVEDAEEINQDAGRCPWVGIYRSKIRYPSRTLGMGTGYRGQRVDLILVMQQFDPTSGKACARRLEDLIQMVIGAVLSDPSLGGTVDALDEFEVQYPDYQRLDNGFFQTAFLFFTGVTNVNAA